MCLFLSASVPGNGQCYTVHGETPSEDVHRTRLRTEYSNTKDFTTRVLTRMISNRKLPEPPPPLLPPKDRNLLGLEELKTKKTNRYKHQNGSAAECPTLILPLVAIFIVTLGVKRQLVQAGAVGGRFGCVLVVGRGRLLFAGGAGYPDRIQRVAQAGQIEPLERVGVLVSRDLP